MLSFLRQTVRVIIASILATVMALPPNVMAEAHVISQQELREQIVVLGQSREQNLQLLAGWLRTSTAEKAMKSVGTDARQIKTAMASLDNEELARLAARAQKAEADFAAGRLSDRDLLVILIAVVALVLIIVAVRR